MTLYTKIRPKTFDEVKGQEFTVNNLRMQSIRDKFFQVIVLAGQYGAGKTTLALSLIHILPGGIALLTGSLSRVIRF